VYSLWLVQSYLGLTDGLGRTLHRCLRVAIARTPFYRATRHQDTKSFAMPISSPYQRRRTSSDNEHDHGARLINASTLQNQYDTFTISDNISRSPDNQYNTSAAPTTPEEVNGNMSHKNVEVEVEPTTQYGADIEASHSRDHGGDFVTQLENNSLARGLQQRHIQMIAIAGAIGTGLFLGLGGSIQTGGPLGALLGYATVGLIVCAVQFALGEVAALLPVTGSFVRHAEFLVDPAFGFAIGLNIVYGNLLSVPAEISAICVLFQYWTDLNPSVFICIFIVLTFLVGISFVGIYGEVEFFFACLKILLVVFLIIFGLVIDLGGIPGQERLGFRYWKTPGPFVEHIASGPWGQFLGYWAVMTNAVFSFAGVESLAMAAAETQNPRRNIPKACKKVFARVLIFYVLAGMQSLTVACDQAKTPLQCSSSA
jgi:amino acid transporter